MPVSYTPALRIQNGAVILLAQANNINFKQSCSYNGVFCGGRYKYPERSIYIGEVNSEQYNKQPFKKGAV